MSGFEYLGAHDPNYVGFDYTSLLKGAGGLLSGVAEGFGDKKSGGDSAAQQKLEAEKRAAEKSASTMKMLLIGVAALVGVGGIVFLARRKG